MMKMMVSTAKRRSASGSGSVKLVLLLVSTCFLLQVLECVEATSSLEKDLTLTFNQKQTLDKVIIKRQFIYRCINMGSAWERKITDCFLHLFINSLSKEYQLDFHMTI